MHASTVYTHQISCLSVTEQTALTQSAKQAYSLSTASSLTFSASGVWTAEMIEGLSLTEDLAPLLNAVRFPGGYASDRGQGVGCRTFGLEFESQALGFVAEHVGFRPDKENMVREIEPILVKCGTHSRVVQLR
jgi:hypothetical protein